MDKENHQNIQTAIEILDNYPDRSHPSRFYDQSSQHIRPPILLPALMDRALSDSGKYNIALEIMKSVHQSEESNKKLQELTEYIINLVIGKRKVNNVSILPILGSRIRFPANDGITPISSFYLKIHAALSEVFHANGAGEYIDSVLREWSRYNVLAEDGTDAELLRARLSLLPV
jgi:hypothetical protein